MVAHQRSSEMVELRESCWPTNRLREKHSLLALCQEGLLIAVALKMLPLQIWSVSRSKTSLLAYHHDNTNYLSYAFAEAAVSAGIWKPQNFIRMPPVQLLLPARTWRQWIRNSRRSRVGPKIHTVMMSEMPRTPCRKTSSATLKASSTGMAASTAAHSGANQMGKPCS